MRGVKSCKFLRRVATHPLGWAEASGGPGTSASPKQAKAWRSSSRYEVTVIRSYWRRSRLCSPPESDPARGWGCCTGAGWDWSPRWASCWRTRPTTSRRTSAADETEVQLKSSYSDSWALNELTEEDETESLRLKEVKRQIKAKHNKRLSKMIERLNTC